MLGTCSPRSGRVSRREELVDTPARRHTTRVARGRVGAAWGGETLYYSTHFAFFLSTSHAWKRFLEKECCTVTLLCELFKTLGSTVDILLVKERIVGMWRHFQLNVNLILESTSRADQRLLQKQVQYTRKIRFRFCRCFKVTTTKISNSGSIPGPIQKC